MDEMVIQIKEIYEKKPEQMYLFELLRIPQEVNECKTFIKDSVDLIGKVSLNYNNNLSTLAEINKRLKHQAKNYFERYKELKHQFKKDREEYRVKIKMLENDVSGITKENSKLQEQLDDMRLELKFFRSKANVKIEGDICKGY
jgi:chromosome segregation ATPase